jgi:hypothetical protein
MPYAASGSDRNRWINRQIDSIHNPQGTFDSDTNEIQT